MSTYLPYDVDAEMRRVMHIIGVPFWLGVYRGRTIHSIAELDEVVRAEEMERRQRRALSQWRARLAREPLADAVPETVMHVT